MSSSRRTRRSYRRYDRRDEDEDHGCSGPINALLYMVSACSAIMNMDSPRSSSKYNSDDDDVTEVTEMSSHSSDRNRSASRSRRDRSSTRPRSSSRTRQREIPRSRSHSVRPDHRSRNVERESQERIRSRSFSRSHHQPIPDPVLPVRENTVVQVKYDDDDISAISAGTLEHMERLQILQQANTNLHRRKQQTPDAAVFKPVITMGKENLKNFSSPDRSKDSTAKSQSSQSSTGTSEFESVWNTPTKSESSRRRSDEYGAKVDNYHLQGKRSSRVKSGSNSHRVPFETPNTRKMKRQIQRDWIGTIEEKMYSDEEEI